MSKKNNVFGLAPPTKRGRVRRESADIIFKSSIATWPERCARKPKREFLPTGQKKKKDGDRDQERLDHEYIRKLYHLRTR